MTKDDVAKKYSDACAKHGHLSFQMKLLKKQFDEQVNKLHTELSELEDEMTALDDEWAALDEAEKSAKPQGS